MLQLSPKQAFGLVLAQLMVTLTLSAALLAYEIATGRPGYVMAYSGLVGGLIATAANAWFAHKVFNLGQIEDPAKVLRSFYWGEINKILLTGALFITVFVVLEPISGAALIAVYFIAHMTPFVASIWVKDT